MNLIREIQAGSGDLVAWRHQLHAHPELAFEERQTASFVADKLAAWGLEVHRGLARTGVVGTLSRGTGGSIGLRADMDALPITETNTFDYRSRYEGKMHACGHDGHTTMLLGAARHLAEHGKFSGTVRFIFQPAEEAVGGAKVMVEDGLFKLFPVDAVFGMHNWPGLAPGHFAMCAGPMMASMDCFDLRIRGRGAHGALPHQGIDPVFAAAQVVSALQSIVSRNVSPLETAVISVTKIHGGDAYNVIPDAVELAGAIRCLDRDLRERLKTRVRETAEGVCKGLGAEAELSFRSGHPAVVNHPKETSLASRAAAAVVGESGVDSAAAPVMVSEDFAYMLEETPGCYAFIGNGAGSCMIHNSGYDFNDEILAVGASYWVRLAEAFLGRAAA
ncbi:MAG TPA: M20 aminoacylase family protein [Gammaproteobacteria bacterium]|jgi:hippurate hydrolase